MRIDFGGKSRTLRFDLDAMLAIEAETGKTTGQVLADLANLSFSMLAYALWAGLKHEEPHLTPKLTLKMLRTYIEEPGGSIAIVRKAVSTAMHDSIWWKQIAKGNTDDEDGEGDEGNATPAAPTPGALSD